MRKVARGEVMIFMTQINHLNDEQGQSEVDVEADDQLQCQGNITKNNKKGNNDESVKETLRLIALPMGKIMMHKVMGDLAVMVMIGFEEGGINTEDEHDSTVSKRQGSQEDSHDISHSPNDK